MQARQVAPVDHHPLPHRRHLRNMYASFLSSLLPIPPLLLARASPQRRCLGPTPNLLFTDCRPLLFFIYSSRRLPDYNPRARPLYAAAARPNCLQTHLASHAVRTLTRYSWVTRVYGYGTPSPTPPTHSKTNARTYAQVSYSTSTSYVRPPSSTPAHCLGALLTQILRSNNRRQYRDPLHRRGTYAPLPPPHK